MVPSNPSVEATAPVQPSWACGQEIVGNRKDRVAARRTSARRLTIFPVAHDLSDPAAANGPAASERGGVDDEAVADVARHHALPRLVDLIGRDDLDLGAEAVLRAEVEHLLRLRDTADHRAGQRLTPADQRERG